MWALPFSSLHQVLGSLGILQYKAGANRTQYVTTSCGLASSEDASLVGGLPFYHLYGSKPLMFTLQQTLNP